MDANEKTGNYIRTKREMAGLSQKDLADMIDVSYPVISIWENGKSSIKKENVEKLASVFGVTVAEILAGQDLDLSQETKEVIARRFQEVYESLGDVQNISITVEDRGILATDIGISALGLAVIALAVAIWGAFPHTVINLVLSVFLGLFGVAGLIFGRFVIKKMEKQLKARKKK